MAKPIYRRVVVKVSGEALMGPEGFGIHQPTLERIAADLVATQRAWRRARHRGRRRQHLPRREGIGKGHSARDRRHHGHAGDGHERAGALETAIEQAGARARTMSALGDAGDLRDLRAAACPAPSRGRTAWCCSPAGPAIRSSPPTPPPCCAPPRSAPRRCSRRPMWTASTAPIPRRTRRPSATTA